MSELVFVGLPWALNRSLKHDLWLKRERVCDGDEEVQRRRFYDLTTQAAHGFLSRRAVSSSSPSLLFFLNIFLFALVLPYVNVCG